MFEDIFKDIEKEAPEDFIKERRLPDGRIIKEFGPFVYGYSVKIGPDGKPIVREFGNVRPSTPAFPFGRPKMELKKEREPLVDVLDVGDSIKVVVELPGVEKSDINLDSAEKTMTISVDTEARKYYKKVELPAEIDPDSAKASYTNGILEVEVKKAVPTTKGKRIKVE
ncbi:MAG: Hsp20/alpha crystallin family protein [archaeon]|nr:Hsp20/alpha crystallin family protein [archaeon]MCP8306601.1 Hsp20/alpha crystallin family protein [archaeon]